MDYRKTEVCDPIIAANRHHCYVPAEVWEVDAGTVCGVCQAKNATLISALIQKIHVEVQQPIAVRINTPVVSIKAFGMHPKPFCQICGSVRLRVSHWDAGQRECSNCGKRICRFCGREVSVVVYKVKDQTCTRKECRERFYAEGKQIKSVAS